MAEKVVAVEHEELSGKTQDAQDAQDAQNTSGKFHFEADSVLDVVPKLDKYWWHYAHLRKLNLLLLCAIMWSTASGFDGSMFNGLQALPYWKNYFGNPTGERLSVSTLPSSITGILTNLVMYYILERFGRRRPLIIGCVLIIIGALIKGGSQNYAMWIWVPIIQTIGTSMVAVSSPPYITECAYPTHRAKAVALYSCTYQLGSLLAAGLNYAILKVRSNWGWRAAIMAQAVPSIIQLVLAIFAPESPRWLIYNDRQSEAFEMLVKYHAGGDRDSRLVCFEMAEISASLRAEKEMNASRWREWIATKGNRHRLAINIFLPAALQLAGNALISYYLPIVLATVGITDTRSVLGINLGLAAWALCGGLFSASVIDKFGRRILICSGFALMFVSFFILTIAAGVDSTRNFKDSGLSACVVLMIFLFQSFYHLSSSCASTYIMEITPFSLRSKASTLYNICGALPSLYNGFANPPIMQIIGWKYYILWTCLLAVEFTISYFIIPETKNKGLEEVAEVFDGKGVIAGVNAMKKFGMEDGFTEAV